MTEIANQNIDIEVVETGGDTAQYFWHNTTDSGAGEGAGAHITEIPKEDFIDDPDAGGMNTLINTNGMAVRDGLTELGLFSAEQIRLGDLDGGNIVIVPTGLNINKGTVQFATFDIEDGIMFKTQQGADALSVAGEGELVTRTIKNNINSKDRVVFKDQELRPQYYRRWERDLGVYPTDKTLTVRITHLYSTTKTYSNYTLNFVSGEGASVEVDYRYYPSSDAHVHVYLNWKLNGELALTMICANDSDETEFIVPATLYVDTAYVSYQTDVYIPKISTDGHLYLYGHSTPVGDLMDVSTSDYSNTYSSGSSSWVYPQGDGTYSSENGLLLPAGRWIIQASLRLQTLTDGAQYGVGVGYGDSRTNATIILPTRQVITAGSTSALILNTTHLVDASGSNRYYVGVYHGSKATVTYMSIRAMRVR